MTKVGGVQKDDTSSNSIKIKAQTGSDRTVEVKKTFEKSNGKEVSDGRKNDISIGKAQVSADDQYVKKTVTQAEVDEDSERNVNVLKTFEKEDGKEVSDKRKNEYDIEGHKNAQVDSEKTVSLQKNFEKNDGKEVKDSISNAIYIDGVKKNKAQIDSEDERTVEIDRAFLKLGGKFSDEGYKDVNINGKNTQRAEAEDESEKDHSEDVVSLNKHLKKVDGKEVQDRKANDIQINAEAESDYVKKTVTQA